MSESMVRRIREICRCMDELELARRDRMRSADASVQLGTLISELDWLEELHYLLHP